MVQLTQFKNEIENAVESTGYRSVPSGEYVVACVSAESKPTKARTGNYILNMYEIQEGEYAGSSLRDIINYDNPNETTRNIAFSTLKSLGIAIGKTEPLTDTSELLGKRIIATVVSKRGDRPMTDDNGMQKLNDKGEPLFFNEISIKKYKPFTVNSAPTNKPVQPSTGGSFPFPQ